MIVLANRVLIYEICLKCGIRGKLTMQEQNKLCFLILEGKRPRCATI